MTQSKPNGMSRGPGLLAHGEFISLSSAQKRKKCYPKKQQGAGTVCASPAKHRLTVCRSPLIALSRISNSTMGLHRTCHFCTLIDALKQTEVSHGKQSLRKLKKKKKDDKIRLHIFLLADGWSAARRAGISSGAVPTYCWAQGFWLLQARNTM